MILNANNPLEVEKAKTQLNKLINKKAVFELTEKRPKRSYAQNRYLHLIFSYFAMEYGETTEYVKQFFFKQVVNSELFKTEHFNPKSGDIRKAWRSTADLNTKELTLAIDRFRNYSSKEAGIYLPSPNDIAMMNNLEIEVEKFKLYN